MLVAVCSLDLVVVWGAVVGWAVVKEGPAASSQQQMGTAQQVSE